MSIAVFNPGLGKNAQEKIDGDAVLNFLKTAKIILLSYIDSRLKE